MGQNANYLRNGFRGKGCYGMHPTTTALELAATYCCRTLFFICTYVELAIIIVTYVVQQNLKLYLHNSLYVRIDKVSVLMCSVVVKGALISK